MTEIAQVIASSEREEIFDLISLYDWLRQSPLIHEDNAALEHLAKLLLEKIEELQ